MLSRAARPLLSLTILAAIFGGLELACRLLGLGEPREVASYIVEWQAQWGRDFFVLKPGGAINRDGLRDREHAIANESGLRRIAFLGDSVTFGYELEPSDSYSAIAEVLLRERGEPAEVLNVALPGWSTRQERIAYQRIVRKYRPDRVVLGLCLNDIAEMQNNLSRPAGPLATAYRHSYLVRALMSAQRWEIERVADLFTDTDSGPVRRGWQLTLDEISRLAEEIRRDGARFALLVLPFRFQVGERPPPPIPQQLLEAFARAEGIDYLDALPALRPLGVEGFIDYDHLSRRGAEAVAEAIVASGLLADDGAEPRK